MKFDKALFALCLLACFVFATPALAEQWGSIYEVKSNLNVREKRTPKSEHVLTLTKGQRVKIDFIKNNWGAVFALDELQQDEALALGYVNVKYLKFIELASTPAAAETQAPPALPAPARGDGEVKAPVATTPPAPIEVGVDPSRIPVEINADRMTYDESGKVVTFIGNVVAKHGELTLWATRLSAFFSSRTNKKFSADSIDRIIAQGQVRAQKGTTEGTCGKLTYMVAQQVLTMEQDPLLKDGPNSLTGEVIKFHMRENRSEVLGGKGTRVKAIFMTPEKMKVQ